MPVPTRPRPTDSARTLLPDLVYDNVLALVISGDLEPGELLREEEIAAWLDVSRTPVRDAINRLRDQGLVVYRPNRGTRVAEIDLEHARMIFQTLAALHGMAARLALPNLTADDVAHIRGLVAEPDQADPLNVGPVQITAVQEIMVMFLERSGNHVLSEAVRRLQPHMQRLRSHTSDHLSREWVQERGGAILTAFTTGSPEIIGQLMQGFFLAFGENLLAEAAEQLGLPLAPAG
ncbi:GntR family transcriptional regulator [Cellulomonas sp. URHB0016]